MTETPSYLPLLNRIAQGEAGAGQYLRAWAESTDDPAVAQVLTVVAVREAEHGLAFEKRISELGFGLDESNDPDLDRKIEVAGSDCTDLEKFDALGLAALLEPSDDAVDPFPAMFEDASLDVQTSALLGRFVGEERDSGRLLTDCYQALKQQTDPTGGASLADLCSAVETLKEQIGSMQASVAELKALARKTTAKKTAGKTAARKTARKT
jgi:hypothetical protein